MKHSKGVFFILISALFYGTYGIWSRLMAQNYGEFSQAWTRGLFLLIIVLCLNLRFKFFKPIQKPDFKWFVLIGIAGGLNQAPYFYGFKYLSIGTATLLFYAALVVGGYILGKLVFNETLTKVKLISLVLALLGMFSIYNFTLSPSQIIPALLTVLAGLMGSAGVVLSKKLSGNYSELQIMTSYFISMVIFNGPISLLLKDSLPALSNTFPWLAWTAYAFALLTANLAVIEGFKHLEASVGSLIGLAEILFGIVFGVLLFGEVITLGIIIGTIIIITSATLPNLNQHK